MREQLSKLRSLAGSPSKSFDAKTENDNGEATLLKRTLLTVVVISTVHAAPLSRAETAPLQPCETFVTPVHLDPHGDNFLSVLSSPGKGHEIDELFTGDVVCASRRSGNWVHVQYVRDGRGITGWAYSGYLRAVTAAAAPSGGSGNTSVTQQQQVIKQNETTIIINPSNNQ